MSTNSSSGDHVFPRPPEVLPDYAHAKARQTLIEKLTAAFKISTAAATAIANAVVDPSNVRKGIGEATDPNVEEIAVPGGTLLGIRTTVWSRRVMADPRNPRIGPSRRHPFAVEPGTGGEDAKFRPVPEPRSSDDASPEIAELVVDVENRHHLTWASQQAARYILGQNNWTESIKLQGVMEAIWLVPTTYRHRDGSASATTLTSVEGSSRITAVHDILGISTPDVPYDDNDAKLRNYLRKVNESMATASGPTDDEAIALRCERVPALILVGFKRHDSSATAFPTAVKSLVALRHVDPPKAWGEGPENESLADEVLDELERRGLISRTQRDYFAGACTRAEARAAHLSDDSAIRAAAIVHLFTDKDARFRQAIRAAVSSQSSRKRISAKMFNDLATALILRATAEDRGKTEQVRRYLRHAFGKAVHKAPWDATDRSTDDLVKEAVAEVRQAIAKDPASEPGPASLELAVRSAFPLVLSGQLNADRGSLGNDQPDRRTPGEVLDAMRQAVPGVFQLSQALRDFAASQPARVVDDNGQIKKSNEGTTDLLVSDVYLRQEFPPPGKFKARRLGNTPAEVLQNCLTDFSTAMEKLKEAHDAIAKVAGNDGLPLVDSQGVDSRVSTEWRQLLSRIGDDLNFWSRTFVRTIGAVPEFAPPADFADDLDGDEAVTVKDPYEDSYDGWDSPDGQPPNAAQAESQDVANADAIPSLE